MEKLLNQLSKENDHESVKVVKTIQRDEKKHFSLGWKWFEKACEIKKLNPEEILSKINMKYKAHIQMKK